MEVIIVGAGIGGLTLALTLHRAGIPAHVFEAASELRPIGAGINMLPHASRSSLHWGSKTRSPASASRPRKRSSTTGSDSSFTVSRSAARRLCVAAVLAASRRLATGAAGSQRAAAWFRPHPHGLEVLAFQ